MNQIDVARGGLEPPPTAPKAAVLPLDDRAGCFLCRPGKVRNSLFRSNTRIRAISTPSNIFTEDIMKAKPAIGVIGGMGPYAGLDLVQKIFDESEAVADQEHVPVALLSCSSSIPDRTEYILGQSPDNPADGIVEVATSLDSLGCKVAGMPCNSAHSPAIFDTVTEILAQRRCTMQLLHLIGESVALAAATAPGPHQIGVLSTYAVHHTGLYQQQINRAGMRCIMPSNEVAKVVHQAIYAPGVGIKSQSNPVTGEARDMVLRGIHHLRDRGATAVILGCTELPLAVQEDYVDRVLLIDSTRALARALIRETFPEKLRSLASP